MELRKHFMVIVSEAERCFFSEVARDIVGYAASEGIVLAVCSPKEWMRMCEGHQCFVWPWPDDAYGDLCGCALPEPTTSVESSKASHFWREWSAGEESGGVAREYGYLQSVMGRRPEPFDFESFHELIGVYQKVISEYLANETEN